MQLKKKDHKKGETEKKEKELLEKIAELTIIVSYLEGKNAKLEKEKKDLLKNYIASDKTNQELKKKVVDLEAKLKRASKENKDDIIDEKPKCLICYKEFAKNANVKHHVKTVHAENEGKKFKCKKCDYTTAVKYNFETHAIIHSKK